MRTIFGRVAWAMVGVLASTAVWADTYTWKTTLNAGTTYNWQDAASWNEGGGFPNQAGDGATIAANFPIPWATKTTISLGGGTVTIGNLTRTGVGWHDISNGTLVFSTLTGDALLDSSSSSYDSITANVTFNTNTTVRNNDHAWGGYQYPVGLTINGVLASSGDYGLYKEGPGILVLANNLNSFSGLITVANGVLYDNHSNASTPGWGQLGNAANSIVLGSVGCRGGLMGYRSSTPFTRSVRLEGVGGMLIPPIPNVIDTVISGPGELLIAYWDNLIFRNTADNTYSGGTRVQNRYTYAYSAAKVFGTGDVTIEHNGRLHLLNPTNNVDAGAKVLITSLGTGAISPHRVGGFLILGSDSVPTIDTNSSGVIALGGPNYNEPTGPGSAAMSSGPNINARFAVGAPQLGNGYMHYGDWGRTQNGTFTGASLQPNLDGVYRFTSGESRLYLDHPGDRVGVLTGTNGVEVFGMSAGPTFSDANTFSGPLRVHVAARLNGYAFSSGVSSFGAVDGPIDLKGGELWVLRGDNAASLAQKGALTFESASMIIMRNSSASYITRFDAASMTRTNGGSLQLACTWGELGAYNRVTAVTPPPVVNGMVPPYFVSDGYANPSKLFFLNYVDGVGFTNASFTAATLSGAQPTDIVGVTASAESVPNGGVEVYALKTAKNLTDNGNGDKIKIGSGGLILQGTTVNTAPIDFGDSEGIVYVGGSPSEGWNHQLNGKLSGTNGLAIGGDHYANNYPGYLTIGADNSSSLTGTVTINHGSAVLISTSANLGPDSNLIVLNSGAGQYTEKYGGLGPAAAQSVCNHPIWLGSEGGAICVNANSRWLKLGGKISGPGFLAITANAGGRANGYITNALNDYTGGTLISGELYVGRDLTVVNGAGKLGTGPVVVGSMGTDGTLYLCGTDNVDPNARVLVLRFGGPGSKLELRGLTTHIGSLEGDGQVYLNYNTASPACKLYTGGNDLSTEFSGIIYDRNGTGQLVKEGAGVFTLSGYNTFGGATTVEEGTLRVNGTLSSPAVVNTGAVLDGKGVLANTVTVTGGTLAPGTSVGTLRTGTLTFDVNSTFEVDIDGVDEGEYDQVIVTGGVNLGGAELVLNLGHRPHLHDSHILIENDGVDPVIGKFAEPVAKGTYLNGSYTFHIRYDGGDGNDVVLENLNTGTLILLR